MQHHAGKLDQFILAIHKVRTVASANPLTSADKTIFHHNFRTTIKPENVLHNIHYYALRVDAVCHVIKEVLGLNFKPSEVQTAVEFVDNAVYGRGYFYNLANNPWPIAKQLFTNETGTMHSVPLPEDELLDGSLSRFRCLFIKQDFFDKIVSNVERGGAPQHDPKLVVIQSANPDVQKYCFYETVTGKGKDPWFGWRFSEYCTFASFCGLNVCNIGGPTTELELNADLEKYNEDCGFPPIHECYQPSFIYQFFADYSINADPDRLPPCFQWDPFGYSNPEGTYAMPLKLFNYAAGAAKVGGKDEMAEWDNDADHSLDDPSSNPLGDRTNSQDSSYSIGFFSDEDDSKRRKVNRRRNPFLAMEAEDEDGDDDDEEVSVMNND